MYHAESERSLLPHFHDNVGHMISDPPLSQNGPFWGAEGVAVGGELPL